MAPWTGCVHRLRVWNASRGMMSSDNLGVIIDHHGTFCMAHLQRHGALESCWSLCPFRQKRWIRVTRFSESQTGFSFFVCYVIFRLSFLIVRRELQDTVRDFDASTFVQAQICSTRIQYSCSLSKGIDGVAVIEQVFMIQTLQKTIENPQLQYINKVTDALLWKSCRFECTWWWRQTGSRSCRVSMNHQWFWCESYTGADCGTDSWWITVQWGMCLQHFNITIPADMFIFLIVWWIPYRHHNGEMDVSF